MKIFILVRSLLLSLFCLYKKIFFNFYLIQIYPCSILQKFFSLLLLLSSPSILISLFKNSPSPLSNLFSPISLQIHPYFPHPSCLFLIIIFSLPPSNSPLLKFILCKFPPILKINVNFLPLLRFPLEIFPRIYPSHFPFPQIFFPLSLLAFSYFIPFPFLISPNFPSTSILFNSDYISLSNSFLLSIYFFSNPFLFLFFKSPLFLFQSLFLFLSQTHANPILKSPLFIISLFSFLSLSFFFLLLLPPLSFFIFYH